MSSASTPRRISRVFLAIVASVGLAIAISFGLHFNFQGSQTQLLDIPLLPVDFSEPVAMRITASAHYRIDTDEGAQEWANLMPPSGHLVYAPKGSSSAEPKPYTVTLFHQLKCLDIIRMEYMGPQRPIPSRMTRHCLNYLRQTIWCRPNLWLESAKNTQGTASRAYDAVCRDWTKVYDAAALNQRTPAQGS